MQSGNPESPPNSSLRAPTPLDSPLVETLAGDELDAQSARVAQRALRIPSDGAAHASEDTAPGISLPPIDDPTTVIQTVPYESIAASSAPTAAAIVEAAVQPAPVPAQAPPVQDASSENGASMRVVRRRIRKVSGETDSPPPLASLVSLDVAIAAPAPEVRPPSPPTPAPAPAPIPIPVPIPSDMPRVSISAEPISYVPQPPSPQIEVSLSDDFEVPPMDDEPTSEIEINNPKPRSVPPPPPLSARPVAIPAAPSVPAAESASSRSMARTVPDLPAVHAPETVAAEPVVHEDEGVEISLEDAAELVSDARRSDPSLALLDALAELPPDAPVIEESKTPTPPKSSLQPPPPPDAARGKPPSPTRATAVTVPDRNKRRKLWWEELFGEDYLRTMEQFTPAQTQTEADWIEQALGVESGASILDVACGVGRQATALAKRGYEVVALDYSLAMLTRGAEVAQEQSAKVTYTQADMCAMEFNEVFDAAYCVGTSFGYFDDEKNAEVARKIHRALKPHGTFLLGVVNRDHVIQRQPGMAWFEGDGCVCMEETSFNFITSRLNVKRTVIFEDGRQRETEYSIRLYSLHELGQVLHAAGFRILEVSGNPRTPAAFFGPSSRELIILAQKRGPEVVEISGLATAPYDVQSTDVPKN